MFLVKKKNKKKIKNKKFQSDRNLPYLKFEVQNTPKVLHKKKEIRKR
jgi:hypothetical protein